MNSYGCCSGVRTESTRVNTCERVLSSYETSICPRSWRVCIRGLFRIYVDCWVAHNCTTSNSEPIGVKSSPDSHKVLLNRSSAERRQKCLIRSKTSGNVLHQSRFSWYLGAALSWQWNRPMPLCIHSVSSTLVMKDNRWDWNFWPPSIVTVEGQPYIPVHYYLKRRVTDSALTAEMGIASGHPANLWMHVNRQVYPCDGFKGPTTPIWKWSERASRASKVLIEDTKCLWILNRWHCKHRLAHIRKSSLMDYQMYLAATSRRLATIPGRERPCNVWNARRR